MKNLILILFVSLLSLSCAQEKNSDENKMEVNNEMKKLEKFSGRTEQAFFAGGCFWCIEAPFENIDGVISVTSGYTGGEEKNPDYEQVSSGSTGHYEAVQVEFDPEIISYSELLDIYWKQFDPTDAGGSFHDRGKQYQSAIFYKNEEQRKVAEESKRRLDQSGIFNKPVVTEIKKLDEFYPAEEYHQDYYKKNPEHYESYKKGSGRKDFILGVWGDLGVNEYKKPSEEEIKKELDDLQYKVTQQDGTERAFNNKYWDNKEAGIYIDIISGEPLFSSKDKFESGTGWPSFTKPIDPRYINKVVDKSHGMIRVEARSHFGDSHLGHIFYDGPEPTNLRYCMNSASMRFIPKDKMKEEGYGEFLWLVD